MCLCTVWLCCCSATVHGDPCACDRHVEFGPRPLCFVLTFLSSVLPIFLRTRRHAYLLACPCCDFLFILPIPSLAFALVNVGFPLSLSSFHVFCSFVRFMPLRCPIAFPFLVCLIYL
ncbi:hypothetical protein C8R45DRAFT_1044207 [Mycena sanguinolenta]|nr:hypothetical protein C8R45DRAFT_1044207 [Mycena sanguinolenta]